MTEALIKTKYCTSGFPSNPRLDMGASFIFEKAEAAAKKVDNSITAAGPSDDYDSDEASPNTTKLLLESHTSTDGSESPRPRWTRGPPPALDGEPTASTVRSSVEKYAPSPPQSPRSDHEKCRRSTSSVKSYVAWTWLLEDEGATEPKLQKPRDGEAVALPHLTDAERELLCQNARRRLQEFGRQSPDASVIVEEYLRFMFLRKRLDGLLTLDPPALVDDVWHAHIASGRDYAAFCERTFGVQRLESGVLRKETRQSQPLLYQNTVEAYEHFFGNYPPPDSWPTVLSVRADAMLKDEDAVVKANSPCRRNAFVRSTEKKFDLSMEAK